MYSCKNIKIPFLTPESFEFSCEFYFHYKVEHVKNKYASSIKTSEKHDQIILDC